MRSTSLSTCSHSRFRAADGIDLHVAFLAAADELLDRTSMMITFWYRKTAVNMAPIVTGQNRTLQREVQGQEDGVKMRVEHEELSAPPHIESNASRQLCIGQAQDSASKYLIETRTTCN